MIWIVVLGVALVYWAIGVFFALHIIARNLRDIAEKIDALDRCRQIAEKKP